MEIVPTSPNKPKEGLDTLLMRKAELKQQIHEQRQQIAGSARQLFSVNSITNYLFAGFKKSMNLMDGLIVGFKFARSINRLFKTKK